MKMRTALISVFLVLVALSTAPRHLRALCAPPAVNSALNLASSFYHSPQTISPDWCKSLPRPAYKTLERVLPNEPWFEVYKVRPGVFAIYEPKQAEEVISYLI